MKEHAISDAVSLVVVESSQVKETEIYSAVWKELNQATRTFPRFNSAHEGLAVLQEEFEELKAEVFRKRRDDPAMRREAVQVAAMAIRFIRDVLEPVM